MSAKAISWAWSQRCGSASRKLVLLSLASHSGIDGITYPKISTIERDTDLKAGEIKEVLRQMLYIGIIKKAPMPEIINEKRQAFQLVGVND